MPAYKIEETGTWLALFYYQNYKGERVRKAKRGFATKRDALEWERQFLQKSAADLSMTFESFVEVYIKDMRERIRENTWRLKESIILNKIIPYFGKKKMNDIQTKDVIAWQNEMLTHRYESGKGYSGYYPKQMHTQLNAILNHAVRHYDLKSNVAAKVGAVGKNGTKEMLFWTKDEYLKFAAAIKGNPAAYCAFEILYWCGLRVGELRSLTPADFDFVKGTV
jgi:integrase